MVVVDTLKPVLALKSENTVLQRSSADDVSSVDATITENPASTHVFVADSTATRRLAEDGEQPAAFRWDLAGFGLSAAIIVAFAALKQFRRGRTELMMV